MELFVRYCAETGCFNTLKRIWNLSKNSTAARVFPFGQRCRFCLCYVELRGKACDQIRPIRPGRPKDSAGI